MPNSVTIPVLAIVDISTVSLAYNNIETFLLPTDRAKKEGLLSSSTMLFIQRLKRKETMQIVDSDNLQACFNLSTSSFYDKHKISCVIN